MNYDDITRYRLQLDMIERNGALGNGHAAELLRREFALAINASYLMGLSCDDIDVSVVARSIPQEGVARYVVTLDVVERTPRMTVEQAAELVRREFQRAQNASHFLRISSEDFSVTLVARERIHRHAELRAA